MKKMMAVLMTICMVISFLPAIAEIDYTAMLDVLETVYTYYEYEDEIGEILDEWLELYDLSGHLVYVRDEIPWDTEYEFMMIAYEMWTTSCNITEDNDYSEACDVLFLQYENGDFQQNLVYVTQLHDGFMMPNFNVLMDFDTKEILATTDIDYYCECLEETYNSYAIVREDYVLVQKMAAEAVIEQYQNWDHPITEAVLAEYECYPVEPWYYWIDEDGNMNYDEEWMVFFYPEGNDDYEFFALIDMNNRVVTDVERDLLAYPNYTENDWNRGMNSLNELEAYYLDAIAPYGESLEQAPLEVRYEVMQYINAQLDSQHLYDWMMVCMEYDTELRFVNDTEVFLSQALPDEDDIPQEVALSYAKEFFEILGYTPEEIERWNCNVFCYEYSAELDASKEWYITFKSEDERYEYSVEFDAESGLLLYASEVDWVLDEYTYLEPSGDQLEAFFGPFQDWTLEQKMHYGNIFGWYPDERMPAAETLSEDEALAIAKQALVDTFDQASMDELNALDAYIYYYNYVNLFDVEYEEPIYYFSFMTPELVGCYEAVMNAVTGEILVLHDPDHSGNG